METSNCKLAARVIRTNYRVVTPMFCGGAEQQAEFRLASFKGVLRFWWRALEWCRIQDLTQLHREEAALFGSSDGGQAGFLMRLDQETFGAAIPKKTQLKDGPSLVGHGTRYLGYGAIEAYGSARQQPPTKDAELKRECFPAGVTIAMSLRFKSGKLGVTNEQQLQIERALKIAGLLGGVGGKSRKGYGSLTLTRLTRDNDDSGNSWRIPKTLPEFRGQLLDLLRPTSAGKGSHGWNATPLTAITKDSRIVLIAGRTGESTMKLLDRIGRELVQYRSWGNKGKVLGSIDREENFKGDHDLMKQEWTKRTTHPKRIAFGLPHNYGPKREDQVSAADAKLDRRASSLFIHIHQAEGSPPLGVLTFLPGLFLPEGRDRISVGGRDVPLQSQDLWKPVEDFLDRLLDESARKEFAATDHIEELEVADD